LSFLVVIAGLLAPHSAEAEPPVFVLHTAGGATATGPLRQLGDNWLVRVGGKDALRAEGTELVCLRRAGAALPPYPAGEQVLLANGDRIPGQIRKLAGERVHFVPEVGDGQEMILPLSALSAIWLTAPDPEEQPDRKRRELAAGKRSQDVVHLRNGDVLEGVVTGLERDKKQVQIQVAKKAVEVAFDKVAAIAFNTDLVVPSRRKGPYGRLTLANGGRLSVASVAWSEGKPLTAQTLSQTTLQIPVEQVVALYLYQGRAVYLSDLKARKYGYDDYLGSSQTFPLVPDGSVRGLDLGLRDGTFDKGLGTHVGARITYDLAGGYQRFEALAGLDETSGKKGAARLRVLVDGQEQDLGKSAAVTHRGGPLPVRIDVAGAKELTLIVDFDRFGHVQGDVNWADARLIK
jgi:hypothetical protein